jgi:hypothetical protein
MNPPPVRSSRLALAVLFGLALPAGTSAQAPVHVQTFHRELINWNDAHAKTFAFPAASIAFRQVILTIKLECPGGGCDPWDRSATVTIKGKDDAGRVDTFEIARFITPYGVGCSWTADVTDYRPLLAGSAELGVHIDTFIGGQKGWLVSLDFEFTPGTPLGCARSKPHLVRQHPHLRRIVYSHELNRRTAPSNVAGRAYARCSNRDTAAALRMYAEASRRRGLPSRGYPPGCREGTPASRRRRSAPPRPS